MTSLKTLKTLFVLTCITLASHSFAQKGKSDKNKFLEGKKYDVAFTEIKATGTPKPFAGVIALKGGQIHCDEMEEKLKVPAMAYKVSLDSVITEDDAEMHKVNFNGEAEENKTTFKWEAEISDYEIVGTVIMLKGGVEKKRFEYSGAEKAKKK